jgi:hypothetical protein
MSLLKQQQCNETKLQIKIVYSNSSWKRSDANLKINDKELNFVFKTLDPFLDFSENEKETFSGLNELKFIQILRKNKVLTEFSRKLAESKLEQIFLSKYPTLNKLIEELKSRHKNELDEFLKISKRLATVDVHLLLIKSEGLFPHESSNFDCLIKSEKLGVCNRVLREEGYRELTVAREPHKYLYRKIAAPKDLPLHIHTKVEWEAEEFADAQTLRRNARPFLNEDSGAMVPSIEDSILITIAHYFFEDHEIKLYDLLKLYALSMERELDWDYMFDETIKLGWNDAFVLNLQLVNRMSVCCFGQDILREFPKSDNSKQAQLALGTITFDEFGRFKIPYGVSALFFIQKVFRTPHLSFFQKSQHIDYVISDILRRKITGYWEFEA